MKNNSIFIEEIFEWIYQWNQVDTIVLTSKLKLAIYSKVSLIEDKHFFVTLCKHTLNIYCLFKNIYIIIVTHRHKREPYASEILNFKM